MPDSKPLEVEEVPEEKAKEDLNKLEVVEKKKPDKPLLKKGGKVKEKRVKVKARPPTPPPPPPVSDSETESDDSVPSETKSEPEPVKKEVVEPNVIVVDRPKVKTFPTRLPRRYR